VGDLHHRRHAEKRVYRSKEKGTIMKTIRIISAGTLAVVVVLAANASAYGIPYEGEDPAVAASHDVFGPEWRRPLSRIGTQFVRGDNLTGAALPAPAWVPVLYEER
jgi:hypothetical protein